LYVLDSSYCDARPHIHTHARAHTHTHTHTQTHTHTYIYIYILAWPCPFAYIFSVHATFHSKQTYLTVYNKEDSMINVSFSRSKDCIQFQIQTENGCCKIHTSAHADEIPAPSREPHVIHAVHVLIINILSNKGIPGTTHMTYINSCMFQHLGAILRELLQQRGITATKGHRPICQHILFIIISIIKYCIIKIHNIFKIHEIDSNIT
jgi:hypothetical protein